MDNKPTAYHRKLVKEFEEAVREHEMKGAQHPQSHEWIDSNYRAKKAALLGYLARHTDKE